MRRAALAFALFASTLTGPLRASSVSTELAAGTGVDANATSSSTFTRERISASIAVSDPLTLRASFTGLQAPTAAEARAADLVAATLGLSYESSPQWAFGFDLSGVVPGSTLVAVAAPDPRLFRAQTATTSYRSRTTTAGVHGFVEHTFTDPEDEDELGVTIEAGVARFDATTSLGATTLDGVAVTEAELAARCGFPACRAALAARTTSVTSTLLQGALGATLFGSAGPWSFDASAMGYAFSEDPSTFGTQTLTGSGGYVVGDGLPVLPLRASFGGTLMRQVGSFTLEGTASFSPFAVVDGYAAREGLRVRYRATRTLSFWVGSGSQQTAYDGAAPAISLWGLGGARVRF